MERLSVKRKRDLNEIYRRIFKGSMPELYADENVDPETYYRSYVDTYLQRDIRDLTQAADQMQFYNFMTILKVEIGTGSVVCLANDLLPVDEKNWYVPVWLI